MIICGPPPLMYYREDFNRADSADLGPDWNTVSGSNAVKIAGNAAENRNIGSADTTGHGCWEQFSGGQLLTDNWQIRAGFKAPSGTAATNRFSMVIGAMAQAMSSGMCVYGGTVYGTGSSGSHIVTQSGQVVSPYKIVNQSGQTTRSSANGMGSGAYEVTLERKGNLFRLLKDGALWIGWSDGSGVVPKGEGNRGFGIITEGYRSFFPFVDQISHAIDWIEAYDIVP